MQFLSALVEHLVVGIISLLWVMPVLNFFSLVPDVKLSDHKEIIIAVGVPVAYVVGVYVDVLSSIFTSTIRLLIDNRHMAWRKAFFGAHISASGGRAYQRTVEIMKKSPDEATKYLLLLSGREKIARGVFASVTLASILNSFLPKSIYTVSSWLLLAVAILGLLIWLRLNALTDNFKDQIQ